MKRIAILLLVVSAGACSAPETSNQVEQAQAAGFNAAEIVVPQGAVAGDPDGNAAQARGPGMSLSPEGLTLVSAGGSTTLVGFGVAQDDATHAAGAVLGKPENEAANPDCPAGSLDSVDFADGLTLFFEGAKFVGWDVDDSKPGRFTTVSGVGIGSTRREIQQSIVVEVEDTSLGHEFRSGALSGLLSAPGDSGRVMQLWAGTTCIFR